MITSGGGATKFDIVGVIKDVYEDLGPSCKVTVSEINGKGMYTFDVSEFPFPADEVKQMVGCTVRIVSSFEVEILKTKEGTDGLA
jgi:hypothetical protein